jgi:hypothetical protein
VADAAAADGLRLGEHLLAPARAVATHRRLAAVARGAAGAAGWTSGGRWSIAHRCAPSAGKKTGPNPADRRKAGFKHHVMTDGRGVPLVAQVTAAKVNDITQLDRLIP